MELRVKRLRDNAVLPEYAHPGDAGVDLYAAESTEIPPGGVALVHTGIAIELPVGTEAQVRPRSGLALKQYVTVLNAPGTIDERYRGEVDVILINHGPRSFHVHVGDKIAQLVVKPVLRLTVKWVPELTETARGERGFGSTGISGDAPQGRGA